MTLTLTTDTTELVPVLVPLLPLPLPLPLPAANPRPDVLAAFLEGLSPRTLKAYTSDLADFAAAILAVDARHAVEQILSLTAGEANALALAYRNRLVAAGLASATIARRLAALRSVVKLARTLGRVEWSIEIRGPKIEKRRDTRGPDPAERKKLWRTLRAAGDSPRARRDRAIVALLFDLALRRGEVVALDLVDVDLAAGTVAILGKGRREKERLTLPAATRDTLTAWIDVRGSTPGPLFPSDHAADNRITGDGVAYLVRELGKSARLPRQLRPHGFRHSAITSALESGSDVRQVRKYSRHAKLETVLLYDDTRGDVAGEIARGVSRERK